MHVQIVTFNLKDISDRRLPGRVRRASQAVVAQMPGLVSKVWLADEMTNTYGGVYTWVDRPAMEAYLRSDFFAGVAANPSFAECHVVGLRRPRGTEQCHPRTDHGRGLIDSRRTLPAGDPSPCASSWKSKRQGLLGVKPNRAVLHQLLAEGGPLVVFIHGIAGVGKSTLAEAFAVEARARWGNRPPARLPCDRTDCARVPAALAATTGGDLGTSEEAAAPRLGSLGDQVILALDTYEVFRLFDPWLRQTFMPALGANVRIVISGREPPMTGWPSSLGARFEAFHSVDLSREDAETLLRRAGVDRADVERINQLARGHPLSLQLAASALAQRPGC